MSSTISLYSEPGIRGANSPDVRRILDFIQ
ncbi:hypothetical protein Tco_1250404, partial [Tanacetum coccineum]